MRITATTTPRPSQSGGMLTCVRCGRRRRDAGQIAETGLCLDCYRVDPWFTRRHFGRLA